MIRDNLRARITSTRCVLLDFDGPLCRLFTKQDAQSVADDMRQLVKERGTTLEAEPTDPAAILRAADELHPGSQLVTELERSLTEQELRAVPGAWPTMYADRLIQTWRASGCRLAVTTDTSAGAVGAYLAQRGLAGCFAPYVYGRTPGPGRPLVPQPQVLRQALRDMGADPATALMIGASVRDLRAAESAGVAFLGYATDDLQVEELASAGAELVLNTFEPVLDILWRG